MDRTSRPRSLRELADAADPVEANRSFCVVRDVDPAISDEQGVIQSRPLAEIGRNEHFEAGQLAGNDRRTVGISKCQASGTIRGNRDQEREFRWQKNAEGAGEIVIREAVAQRVSNFAQHRAINQVDRRFAGLECPEPEANQLMLAGAEGGADWERKEDANASGSFLMAIFAIG